MKFTKTPNMSFGHNSSYSGEVIFSLPNTPDRREFFETSCAVLAQALLAAGDKAQVAIMACRMPIEEMTTVFLAVEDISSFLAGRVQSERIQKLEAMTDEELDQLGRQDEYLRWAKEDE